MECWPWQFWLLLSTPLWPVVAFTVWMFING